MGLSWGLTVALAAMLCLQATYAQSDLGMAPIRTRRLSSFLGNIGNDLNNKLNMVGTVLNQQLNQDQQNQQALLGQQQQQDTQIQNSLTKDQQNQDQQIQNQLSQDQQNQQALLNKGQQGASSSNQNGNNAQPVPSAVGRHLLARKRNLMSFLPDFGQDITNKLNLVGTILNQQNQQDSQIQNSLTKDQQNQDQQIQNQLSQDQQNQQALLNKGQQGASSSNQNGNNAQPVPSTVGRHLLARKRNLMSFLPDLNNDINNKLNVVGTILNQQLNQDQQIQQGVLGQQQKQDSQIQNSLTKDQQNQDQQIQNQLSQDQQNQQALLNKGQQGASSSNQNGNNAQPVPSAVGRHLLANKRRELLSFLPNLDDQQKQDNQKDSVHSQLGQDIANQLNQDQQIQNQLDQQFNKDLINPINKQITAVGSAVESQWEQDAKIQQNILGQWDQQDQKVQKQITDQLNQDHQNQQALLNKNQSPVLNQSPILNQDQQKQDQEIQKQLADQLAQDEKAQQALLNKSPVSQSPVSSTSPAPSGSSSGSNQNVQNNVVPPQGRRLRERESILQAIFGERA